MPRHAGVGDRADQPIRSHVPPPRDVECAVRQAHIAGRQLAQSPRHKGRGRGVSVGQHRAAREQSPDALTEIHVEETDHQSQVTVELLNPKRGMDVADVVLADQGHRTGLFHLRSTEGTLAQLGRLDHPYLR